MVYNHWHYYRYILEYISYLVGWLSILNCVKILGCEFQPHRHSEEHKTQEKSGLQKHFSIRHLLV